MVRKFGVAGGFNPKGEGYNNYLRLVSSPSCGDGIIVAPTAKGKAVLGLRVPLQGDVTGQRKSLHWKLPKGTPDVATPVIYEGLVYLAGEKGDPYLCGCSIWRAFLPRAFVC